MINVLRLNIFYLNFLILLSIILKFEILILIFFTLRITVHTYRLMLLDTLFAPLDILSKNHFFEDLEEHKSYQEFEVETADIDGYYNFEIYSINSVEFLPDIFGGDFSLNWEDFVLENNKYNFYNLNNLNYIYIDINYTNFNYYKIFNNKYDNNKTINDRINLYDYYYYHRASFENFNFDFQNERIYYNKLQSKFLDTDYYNLHINKNEIKLINFNSFIKLLKNNLKKIRLKN